MSTRFDFDVIRDLQHTLANHPVYSAVSTIDELRVFMAHHVYSVWDFMSLIKYLQGQLAPTTVPWVPRGRGAVRYFINQLVLEEESDQAAPGVTEASHMSHFELYCGAMDEIGADGDQPRQFIEQVRSDGLEAALASERVPAPSREFVQRTFGFIAGGRPHVVAAALALGREHVIPDMFRSFLARMGIGGDAAPTFHYYLQRHVHLDEDFHGPLSIQMVEALCEDDPQRMREAEQAAREALQARLAFWDGVVDALRSDAAKRAFANA